MITACSPRSNRRTGSRLVLSLAAALILANATSTACVDEPEVVTCENFDTYLSICYFTCVAGWDCEYAYRAAPAERLETLDYCSECLAEEADLACHDCVAPSGDSCQALLVDVLGLDCAW